MNIVDPEHYEVMVFEVDENGVLWIKCPCCGIVREKEDFTHGMPEGLQSVYCIYCREEWAKWAKTNPRRPDAEQIQIDQMNGGADYEYWQELADHKEDVERAWAASRGVL